MQQATLTKPQTQFKRKGNSKFPENPQLKLNKMKYANAIAWLLAKNIKQSELKDFFADNEYAKQHYETLKKFRQEIINVSPSLDQWVDRAFWLGVEVGQPVLSADQTSIRTRFTVPGALSAYHTDVISTDKEFDQYTKTLASIIVGSQIWDDPEMALFDIKVELPQKKRGPQTTPQQLDEEIKQEDDELMEDEQLEEEQEQIDTSTKLQTYQSQVFSNDESPKKAEISEIAKRIVRPRVCKQHTPPLQQTV